MSQLVHFINTLNPPRIRPRINTQPISHLRTQSFLRLLTQSSRPINLAPKKGRIIRSKHQRSILVLRDIFARGVPDATIHADDGSSFGFKRLQQLLGIFRDILWRLPLVRSRDEERGAVFECCVRQAPRTPSASPFPALDVVSKDQVSYHITLSPQGLTQGSGHCRLKSLCSPILPLPGRAIFAVKLEIRNSSPNNDCTKLIAVG